MKNKFLFTMLFFIISLNFVDAQGTGKFVKLASISINNFTINSASDNKLDLSFKAVNYENKKQIGLKYGFIFKDKNGEILFKKVSKNKFELNPMERKNILESIDFEIIKGVNTISAVLINNRGLYLGFTTISNLPERFPNLFTKYNSEQVKERYKCKIEKDKIFCNESRDGPDVVLTDITIYEKSVFGKRIFYEEIELIKKNGWFIYFLPYLKPGSYEIKFNIGNGRDWFFKFAKAGEYARIDNVRLVKFKNKSNEIGLEAIISGKAHNLKSVFGVINKKGVAEYKEGKVGLGVNRYNLKLKNKINENEPYFFLLDENSEVIDSFNTYGKPISYFKKKFYRPIKKNNFNNINMIYLIYAGVIFLILGLLFVFKKRSAAKVLMLLGVVSVSFGFGYGQIIKADENTRGGLAGIFGEHYNIVTSLNPSMKMGMPGVYLSDEVVQFGIMIADQKTGEKYKDISAYYSIDGGTYNEIVGMTSEKADYPNIGIGILPIGTHIIKIKYVLKPVFDVTNFGFGWFDEISEEQTFAVQILDQNNPFGNTDPNAGDTGGYIPVKDLQFCKTHPQDPDCHCNIFENDKDPSDVCLGEAYVRYNHCGASEQLIGENKSPNCYSFSNEIHHYTCIPDDSIDYSEIAKEYCAGTPFVQIDNCGKWHKEMGTNSDETNCVKELQQNLDEFGRVSDSTTNPYPGSCNHNDAYWRIIRNKYCRGHNFTARDNCYRRLTDIGLSDEDGCKIEVKAILEYTTSSVVSRNSDSSEWKEYSADVNPYDDNDWITIPKNRPIYFRIKPGTGLAEPAGWVFTDKDGGKVVGEITQNDADNMNIATVKFNPLGEGIHRKREDYTIKVHLSGAMANEDYRTVKIHVVSNNSVEN